METFGFIMSRHVNSENTNNYWNHSIKLLRTFYPNVKIIIIDDNSNQHFVKPHFNYKNIEIVKSEFPGRGELLPYYYFLKNKYFQNAVILHDSVFFHKRINFENLQNLDVLPLWHFNSDTENIPNTLRITNRLKNNQSIQKELLSNDSFMQLSKDMWYGCFGCISYINYNFLSQINEKYNIINLIGAVKNRADRCCLERIMGCIFFKESIKLKKYKFKSFFGNIIKYRTLGYNWGYTYNNYMNDSKKRIVRKKVIKVWTGR